MCLIISGEVDGSRISLQAKGLPNQSIYADGLSRKYLPFEYLQAVRFSIRVFESQDSPGNFILISM
jgi:hypothetical protein